MTDALLDAILAAPDDDAPRLVWADREGGERGELVVVQCALAKPLERADRDRLQAREKELLARFPLLSGFEFRRGFVEHLTIERDKLQAQLDAIFPQFPTLRSLDVRPLLASIPNDGPAPQQVWDGSVAPIRDLFARIPSGRITRLVTAPSVSVESDWSGSGYADYHGAEFMALLAEAPALAGLTELELWASGLNANATPHFTKLRQLTLLRIDDHFYDGPSLVALLRAIPTLRTLMLSEGHPGAGSWIRTLVHAPEFEQLTKLEVRASDLYQEDRAALAELRDELRRIVIVK